MKFKHDKPALEVVHSRGISYDIFRCQHTFEGRAAAAVAPEYYFEQDFRHSGLRRISRRHGLIGRSANEGTCRAEFSWE